MDPIRKILGDKISKDYIDVKDKPLKKGIFLSEWPKGHYLVTVEQYREPGEQGLEIESYETTNKSEIKSIVSSLKKKYNIKVVFHV